MELLHVMRDNINFDLRETFPTWFRDYPMIHLMAHYPAPFPASENEYRIPADREIRKSGPDLAKAVLSRAAGVFDGGVRHQLPLHSVAAGVSDE